MSMGMRIAILMPVHGDTKAEFTLSLAAMVAKAAPEHDLIFCMVTGGSEIAKVREYLAEQALGQLPDYLLWLDSDHTFPPDTLHRLLARDLGAVGANYARRFGPRSAASLNGDSVPPRSGVEPVDVMGLGVCLVRADLVRRLPAPRFSTAGGMSEDVYFFTQLRAITKERAHVDHDLSREVGHIMSVTRFLDGAGD